MTDLHSKLFDLPREIRDEIYRYISLERLVRWKPTPLPYPAWRPDEFTIFINFYDLPQRDVLLVCSRLKNEYMEGDTFQNLSATVKIPSTSSFARFVPALEDVPKLKQTRQAFAHLHHLTIFIGCYDYFVGSQKPFDGFWGQNIGSGHVHDLLQHLPSLVSLRIATHHETNVTGNDSDEMLSGVASNYFRDTPPLSLSLLYLQQRAEGYRVQYQENFFRRPNLIQGLVKVGAYVFTSESTSRIHFWTTNEVIEGWDLKEYVRDENDNAPVPLELQILPKKMWHWREKRGHEQAKAWFETEGKDI